jgi:hypothetical protein
VAVSGSDHAAFKRALGAGQYESAFAYATGLPHIDLADALQLTLLAAQKDRRRFDAMAQRWIVRLIEERRVTLHDVEWATQRFQDQTEGSDGRTGLVNLLKQKPAR